MLIDDYSVILTRAELESLECYPYAFPVDKSVGFRWIRPTLVPEAMGSLMLWEYAAIEGCIAAPHPCRNYRAYKFRRVLCVIEPDGTESHPYNFFALEPDLWPKAKS